MNFYTSDPSFVMTHYLRLKATSGTSIGTPATGFVDFRMRVCTNFEIPTQAPLNQINYSIGDSQVVIRYDAINKDSCDGSQLSILNTDDNSSQLEVQIFALTIVQDYDAGYIEITIHNDSPGDQSQITGVYNFNIIEQEGWSGQENGSIVKSYQVTVD